MNLACNKTWVDNTCDYGNPLRKTNALASEVSSKNKVLIDIRKKMIFRIMRNVSELSRQGVGTERKSKKLPKKMDVLRFSNTDTSACL